MLATLAAASVTAAAHRLRLTVAAVGSAVVAGCAWLSLASVALDRAFAQPTWRALWLDLEVWPLLAAAALVGALALLRRLPLAARVSAVSVAGLLVVVAATAPATRLSSTTMTLVGIGVLVGAGVVSLLLPRRWALAPAATQAVAGAGVLGVAVLQVATAAVRLLDAAEEPWTGGSPTGCRSPTPACPPPGCCRSRCSCCSRRRPCWPRRAPGSTGPWPPSPRSRSRWSALLAAGVVGSLALYPVALWLVVGLLLVLSVAFTAWSLAGPDHEPAGACLGVPGRWPSSSACTPRG